MGFVFPGTHLGKCCFFAFLLAEAPSEQAWGSCRGQWLLLAKEPRDGTFPFLKARACQLLPSFRGTPKHTLFYILLPPGPPRPEMAPFSLSFLQPPNTCLTRPSFSFWMSLAARLSSHLPPEAWFGGFPPSRSPALPLGERIILETPPSPCLTAAPAELHSRSWEPFK